MSTKSSSQPIVPLLELLGRRWSLRVLWELRGGPLTFRALQKACGGLSPTVLNARLSELQALGAVQLGEARGAGYKLTSSGEALGQTLVELDAWARQQRRRGLL